LPITSTVDAINNTEELRCVFLDHNEESSLTPRFSKQSGAGFENVIGAIDGLVICILMSTLSECDAMNCGKVSIICYI
jgi:hypothetical protein